MTHKTVKEACERLGLQVRQNPADGRRSFTATGGSTRAVVYWTASSTSDGLLGLPRVATSGGDTHARSVREISYLVGGAQ